LITISGYTNKQLFQNLKKMIRSDEGMMLKKDPTA
jgi:hypothetical protein